MRPVLAAMLPLALVASCSIPPANAPDARLPIGAGAADLQLVDVDGDGHLDLVSRHLLQDRIVVALGDGSGGFAPATAIATAVERPGAIALGDLDRDGALDLVVATRTDREERIDVLLGRRDGGFVRTPASPIVVRAAQETWKPIVIVADVDEDGALDLVTANGRRNRVDVLRGDGRGGLGAPQSIELAPDGGRFFLALGDIDRDGHLDLAVSHTPEPGPLTFVTILRGDGRGGFASAQAPTMVRADAALQSLADVDGDQRLDLVLTHGHSVTLLGNRGDGTFAPVLGSPLDVALPAYDVAVADVDGDGRADLAAATVDDDSSRVVVLHGSGTGFAPAVGSPYASGPGGFDVATADVDGDGRADIFASCFGGDSVTLVMGR